MKRDIENDPSINGGPQMTTAEMNERHVAVVGASTGIGFETARY